MDSIEAIRLWLIKKKISGLVLIVGLLFLVAGIFHLGFITQFLCRRVMEGFNFGLAALILLFGLDKAHKRVPGGLIALDRRQEGHSNYQISSYTGMPFLLRGDLI
jgi:hypothetical protein